MANKLIIVVGGVFDLNGGRPSRYVQAFSNECNGYLDHTVVMFNGGYYDQLKELVGLAKNAYALAWFADIPNELPKLLPLVKESNPHLVLIQSKNNTLGKYTDDQLFARMVASRADFLVEFKKASGKIITRLFKATREHPCEYDEIQNLVDEIFTWNTARFPLDTDGRKIIGSDDSDSFKYSSDIIIPIKNHVGAFGVERKHHRHEGVDLYAPEGTLVHCMEEGIILYIGPFTGPAAGHPHWRDTQCIMVQHVFGVINYGEIDVDPKWEVGMTVYFNEVLGTVKTVLKVDKGRPMSMLHIERYVTGTSVPIFEWKKTEQQPPQLLDPTSILFTAREL